MAKGNRRPLWLSGNVVWLPPLGGWAVMVCDRSTGRPGSVRATDLFESRKLAAQLASVGVPMEQVEVIGLLCILCPAHHAVSEVETQTQRVMDLLRERYASHAEYPIAWRQQ